MLRYCCYCGIASAQFWNNLKFLFRINLHHKMTNCKVGIRYILHHPKLKHSFSQYTWRPLSSLCAVYLHEFLCQISTPPYRIAKVLAKNFHDTYGHGVLGEIRFTWWRSSPGGQVWPSSTEWTILRPVLLCHSLRQSCHGQIIKFNVSNSISTQSRPHRWVMVTWCVLCVLRKSPEFSSVLLVAWTNVIVMFVIKFEGRNKS